MKKGRRRSDRFPRHDPADFEAQTETLVAAARDATRYLMGDRPVPAGRFDIRLLSAVRRNHITTMVQVQKRFARHIGRCADPDDILLDLGAGLALEPVITSLELALKAARATYAKRMSAAERDSQRIYRSAVVAAESNANIALAIEKIREAKRKLAKKAAEARARNAQKPASAPTPLIGR